MSWDKDTEGCSRRILFVKLLKNETGIPADSCIKTYSEWYSSKPLWLTKLGIISSKVKYGIKRQKAQQWHELGAVACVPTGYFHNCASYAKRSQENQQKGVDNGKLIHFSLIKRLNNCDKNFWTAYKIGTWCVAWCMGNPCWWSNRAYAGAKFTLSPVETLQSSPVERLQTRRSKVYRKAGWIRSCFSCFLNN